MAISQMGIVFHAARAEFIELEPNASDETLTWLNGALRIMFDLGVLMAKEDAAKEQAAKRRDGE